MTLDGDADSRNNRLYNRGSLRLALVRCVLIYSYYYLNLIRQTYHDAQKTTKGVMNNRRWIEVLPIGHRERVNN